MTKAEIYKALEQYEDADEIEVGHVRSMLTSKISKPPLGAIPWWIAIPHRISELANAIERASANPKEECIRKWTMEILLLTNVMSEMKGIEEEE